MVEASNEHFTNTAPVLALEVPAAEVNPEFLSFVHRQIVLSKTS